MNLIIESDWKNHLSSEFELSYFKKLLALLEKQKAENTVIYPASELVFNAFEKCRYDTLKVIIVGQDPYHNPNEAMGMSFSVPKHIRIPPSLLNIFKEIKTQYGFELPKHGDLTSWAQQGVLLLNSVLTVEKNKPSSHRNLGWEIFTDHVIQYISDTKEHLVFLLWGNAAKAKKTQIDISKHLILECAHPSPLARGAFFGNNHFILCNEFLKNKNLNEIDWQII